MCHQCADAYPGLRGEPCFVGTICSPKEAEAAEKLASAAVEAGLDNLHSKTLQDAVDVTSTACETEASTSAAATASSNTLAGARIMAAVKRTTWEQPFKMPQRLAVHGVSISKALSHATPDVVRAAIDEATTQCGARKLSIATPAAIERAIKTPSSDKHLKMEFNPFGYSRDVAQPGAPAAQPVAANPTPTAGPASLGPSHAATPSSADPPPTDQGEDASPATKRSRSKSASTPHGGRACIFAAVSFLWNIVTNIRAASFNINRPMADVFNCTHQ